MHRRAAVAGMFYPADARTLRADAQGYIADSGVEPAPDRVTALIVPHAGYPYSGPTAGCAFARVKGMKPRRVILLGNSHRYRLDTVSVFVRGTFETPLGALRIDEPFAEQLAEALDSIDVAPHELEHALEVQLPFIYIALGDVPIVPVLFGGPASDWHANAGKLMATMTGDTDLLIATTDLSHYYPEGIANEMDHRSLETLMTHEWRKYVNDVTSGACVMCSSSAVAAAMAYAEAKDARDWRLLDYRTSAHASGNFDKVVGYAAVSMERAA